MTISSELLFATIAFYCNEKQGVGLMDWEGMPSYSDIFDHVFVPAMKDYVMLKKEGEGYRAHWFRDLSPREKELKEKIESLDNLKIEFEKALADRIQDSEMLALGFSDLFNKSAFESYAKKRQAEKTDSCGTTFQYDSSGNIASLLNKEEKRQIEMICSLIGSRTYSYWRTVNPD